MNYALRIKLGLALKMVKVNQDSSFVQTWWDQVPNAIYQVPRPLAFWFQRRRYLNGVDLTLYGHGGHLGHVTISICNKSTPLNLRRRHIKFEFNWPSGF